MCIIVYKPAGVDCPSIDLLKLQYENNPDGCGFMFPSTTKDGKPTIKAMKGFMTFDDFVTAYEQCQFKDKPMIFHFRISTGGGIIPELTHPFPVCDDTKCMNYLNYTAPVACCHNGVIKLTSSYGKKGESDTSVFVTKILSLIVKSSNLKDLTEHQKTLITRLIGASRFILMDKHGNVERLGTGWVNDNGLWFSNTTYNIQKHKPVVTLPKMSTVNAKNIYDCCKENGLFYPIPNEFCPALDNQWGYCAHCVYKEVCDAHKKRKSQKK